MRMERFIPSGATNSRLIGSHDGTVAYRTCRTSYFTASYPGSQYPNFFDPVGSGVYWPASAADEDNTGASGEQRPAGREQQTRTCLSVRASQPGAAEA
ncbi:MAG: hypothetical protein IPM46_09885 [Flavobacteriales bacterium]|nr:hypothetical protein [Flavobacteriales bacterium]